MSQLRKKHKEEKMKDEAELKKAFKTISCLKNKLESCGSAEKVHWYFVFTGVQYISDLKSQIILTPWKNLDVGMVQSDNVKFVMEIT